MAKRRYYRTAALLGAQPVSRGRRQGLHWPTLRLSRRAALGVAAFLLLVLWLWLDGNWYLSAERLQVEGANPARVAEIVRASGLLGRHILWVDAGAVAEQLSALPAVRSVRVERRLYPAGCRLLVEEREPRLRWEDGMGGLWWLSADGTLFRPVDDRPLPEVVGPLPRETEGKVEIIRSVYALLAVEPSFAHLEYNARYGLIWNDESGREIVFGLGDEGAMEERVAVYRALAADLDRRGVFPLVIDVRFPAAPAYAMDRRL